MNCEASYKGQVQALPHVDGSMHFVTLMELIAKAFPTAHLCLPTPAELAPFKTVLLYPDDEGDTITVASDADLIEAFAVAKLDARASLVFTVCQIYLNEDSKKEVEDVECQRKERAAEAKAEELLKEEEAAAKKKAAKQARKAAKSKKWKVEKQAKKQARVGEQAQEEADAGIPCLLAVEEEARKTQAAEALEKLVAQKRLSRKEENFLVERSKNLEMTRREEDEKRASRRQEEDEGLKREFEQLQTARKRLEVAMHKIIDEQEWDFVPEGTALEANRDIIVQHLTEAGGK
jgi:hypothetical protein